MAKVPRRPTPTRSPSSAPATRRVSGTTATTTATPTSPAATHRSTTPLSDGVILWLGSAPVGYPTDNGKKLTPTGGTAQMAKNRNTLARTMHDVGLAAWFGGSLMGAIGVNG